MLYDYISFQLSKNPITYVGVMGVINGIKKNEACVMSQLNIVSVHVFQSAIELLTEVKEIHPHFKLICGQVVDDVAPIGKPFLIICLVVIVLMTSQKVVMVVMTLQ